MKSVLTYLCLSQSRLNDLVDERASELVFVVEDFGPEVHVASADQVAGCKKGLVIELLTTSSEPDLLVPFGWVHGKPIYSHIKHRRPFYHFESTKVYEQSYQNLYQLLP